MATPRTRPVDIPLETVVKQGVNIFGYVNAESGVGEHTRLLISSVREAGIAYSVVPFSMTLSRQETRFSEFGSKNPEFDVNIIGVNADQIEVFVDHFGKEVLERRFNIALWAWELEDFPEWMAESAVHLDEIWANSSFSARAIADKVECPVHPFPLPIRTPEPAPVSRHELGLAEDTVIVFSTDHGHFFGQHGLVSKGAFHYEDMIKVPFIVSCPGTVPEGEALYPMRPR